MRHRILLLLTMMLLISVDGYSQKRATPSQSKQMISSINKAASRMRTFQCTFTQTKTMKFLKSNVTSHGKMYYSQPGRLRWEYTSPSSYIFIIDGGRVTMKSSRKKSSVDARNNKLFQSISQIMINSVTGRMLQNNKDFTVTMFDGGKEWQARMTPKRGDMKKMFREIRIHFRASNYSVSRVDIFEQNGDTTVVLLSNEKINISINGNIFRVN